MLLSCPDVDWLSVYPTLNQLFVFFKCDLDMQFSVDESYYFFLFCLRESTLNVLSIFMLMI